MTNKKHTPTWKNILYSNHSRYASLHAAAKTAHKIGYDYLCWNDRIYHVYFNNTIRLDDTRLTAEDINAITMPVQPKPKDAITYLLVKVDTDQDIERIVGAIETIENSISPLTRLDVISTSSTLSNNRQNTDTQNQ